MKNNSSKPTEKANTLPLRPFLGPLSLGFIVLIFGTLYPTTFLSPTNLVTNILESVAFVGIVAAAQTVVMVVGDFDLGVSGLAAFATAATAGLLTTAALDGTPNVPSAVLPAVLLGIGIGILGGLFSGWLVSYVGVLAFIATLGMGSVFASFAYFTSDGKPVYSLVENNFEI